MKYVYLLDNYTFNRYTKRYEIMGVEVFSSLKKVKKDISKRVEINKGYDLTQYDSTFKEENGVDYNVDYKFPCMEGHEGKCRYRVRKVQLK